MCVLLPSQHVLILVRSSCSACAVQASVQLPKETMSRLLKIKPRFYQESSSSRTGKTSFAEDSGLVYNEIICNGSPRTSDWTWKTRGSSLEYGRFRLAGPGCSSLASMAVRSVLLNSYSITAECLETLPWRIGQMLWRRIISRSVTTWITVLDLESRLIVRPQRAR